MVLPEIAAKDQRRAAGKDSGGDGGGFSGGLSTAAVDKPGGGKKMRAWQEGIQTRELKLATSELTLL